MQVGKLPKADARDGNVRRGEGGPVAARVRLGRGRQNAGRLRREGVGGAGRRVRAVLAEGGLLHVLAIQTLAVFVEAGNEALSRGLLGRRDC